MDFQLTQIANATTILAVFSTHLWIILAQFWKKVSRENLENAKFVFTALILVRYHWKTFDLQIDTYSYSNISYFWISKHTQKALCDIVASNSYTVGAHVIKCEQPFLLRKLLIFTILCWFDEIFQELPILQFDEIFPLCMFFFFFFQFNQNNSWDDMYFCNLTKFFVTIFFFKLTQFFKNSLTI